MPFRIFVAAFAAALLSTLALMVVRATILPPEGLSVEDNDRLLLHHIGLGMAGSLVLQLLFLRDAPRLRQGLTWGLAGFAVFVFAPWLAQPGIPPGQMPATGAEAQLFWLFSLLATAAGLWLLWRPVGPALPGRLGALILLALPVLSAGMALGDGDRLATPGYGELAREGDGAGPDFGVWLGLGLNLLFWLLLGVFSVVSARRVVQRTE